MQYDGSGMTHMDKCVFCEIIAKSVDPELTVFENEWVIAQISLRQKPGRGVSMHIHGLPGKNQQTEQWLKNLLCSLELGQTTVTVQKYACWQSPGSELDLDVELSVAGKERPDLIVGKSIGTLVALYGYQSGAVRAGAYVFIGMPVRNRPEEERMMLNDLCSSIPV